MRRENTWHSQSGHLRSCLTPSIRTVRPAPVTDSPALPPLHSIPLQLRSLRFRSIAFRSLQTSETVKETSGAPENRTCGTHLAAARLAPANRRYTAGSPGRTTGASTQRHRNSRDTGQLLLRCTCKTVRRHGSPELVGPRLQRLASRPAVSGSPLTPWNWPSFRYAQPLETWNKQGHRAAMSAGTL